MGYRDTTVIREGPPRETVLSAQQPATEGRKAAIIHPRNPDLHPGGGTFLLQPLWFDMGTERQQGVCTE